MALSQCANCMPTGKIGSHGHPGWPHQQGLHDKSELIAAIVRERGQFAERLAVADLPQRDQQVDCMDSDDVMQGPADG